MGVNFEVKPTPIRHDIIKEKSKDMLMGWYKENHPDLYDKINKDEVDPDEFTMSDINNLEAWRLDEEFRAKYCKFQAESCMRFEKDIPDEVWASDELELGTIQEAWDFFTGMRTVPFDGVQAR
jgi:hypothetical protein